MGRTCGYQFVVAWTSSSSSYPLIGSLALFGIGYPPIGRGAAFGYINFFLSGVMTNRNTGPIAAIAQGKKMLGLLCAHQRSHCMYVSN